MLKPFHELSKNISKPFSTNVKKKIKAALRNKDIPIKEYVVTEYIDSMWKYHISEKGSEMKSLCGKETICTGIPLSGWGIKVAHIPERYCEECANILIRTLFNEKTKSRK